MISKRFQDIIASNMSVDDLTVLNNLLITGDTIQIDSEVITHDNLLILNYGEIANGIAKNIAGFILDRGSTPPFAFIFNETDDSGKLGEYYYNINIINETGGSFAVLDILELNAVKVKIFNRVGNTLSVLPITGIFVNGETISNGTVSAVIDGNPVLIDNTQAIATREDNPTDENFAYWDSTSHSFKTKSLNSSDVELDTTNFNHLLTSDDNTVQKALDTIDNYHEDSTEATGFNREDFTTFPIIEFCEVASTNRYRRIDQNGVHTEHTGEITFGDGITPLADKSWCIRPSIETGHTEFSYWNKGIKYIKNTAQVVYATANEGKQICVFDGDTLRLATSMHDAIVHNTIISIVYCDGLGNFPLFADERHGKSLSGIEHEMKHRTLGTVYENGLDIIGLVDGQETYTHTTSGAAWDEDLQMYPQLQTTHPFIYREGIDGHWIWTTPDNRVAYSLSRDNSTLAQYNDFDGTTWTLKTSDSSHDYIIMHKLLTNDSKYPVVDVIGQGAYSSRNKARAAIETEQSRIQLGGLPSPEFKWLYSYIVRRNTDLENLADGSTYVDFRTNNGSGSGGTSPMISYHNDLAGLNDGDYIHLTQVEYDTIALIHEQNTDTQIVGTGEAVIADNSTGTLTESGTETLSYFTFDVVETTTLTDVKLWLNSTETDYVLDIIENPTANQVLAANTDSMLQVYNNRTVNIVANAGETSITLDTPYTLTSGTTYLFALYRAADSFTTKANQTVGFTSDYPVVQNYIIYDLSGDMKILNGSSDNDLYIKLSGSSGTIKVDVSGGIVEVTGDSLFNNDVTITGDLTVNGTRFISNTETVEINGNVGIGTSNPTEKLDVDGNIKTANSLITNGTNTGGIEIHSGNVIQFDFKQTGLTNDFRIGRYDNSGNTLNYFALMIKRDSGNIGIGTSSPTVKLDVAGSIQSDSSILAKYSFKVAYTTKDNGILIGTVSDTSSYIQAYEADLTTAKNLQIQSVGGNLKIGAGLAAEKLDVDGAVKADTYIATSIAEYTDNAAASSAGLTAGAFYRTGDILKVVH